MELLKYVPCLFVSKHFSLNGLKGFFSYYSKALSALQYYSNHRLFNVQLLLQEILLKSIIDHF